MKTSITVGTRGSALALTQANMVISALKLTYPELEVSTKIIKTTGDKILDKELSKIGGKGLFIKEIEEALLDKSIDLAVHSMKDVPHTLSEDFEIGTVLKREDPRDVLICLNGYDINTLPGGAVIGTGSTRRMLQLSRIRPDFEFIPVRGNIDTRIRKLLNGEFDALVLALAGIKRLGWQCREDLSIDYLDIKDFIPSVGQGAMGLEIRKGDDEVADLIKILNSKDDEVCVMAERAFLREIDGGCEIPVGAYAKIEGNQITIDGFIGDENTKEIFREKIVGNMENFEELGVQLAKNCLSRRSRAGG